MDGRPISVVRVSIATDEVTAKVVRTANPAIAIIELSLRPVAHPESRWGEAVVELDHPQQSEVKIQFAINTAPPPTTN